MRAHFLAWPAVAMMAIGGCSAETRDGSTADETLTKDEARSRGGKSDSGLDFCELFDWYGDGVCDDFCLYDDPDCDSEPDAGASCHEDEDCPQPLCLPGGPCPTIVCDEGECVEQEPICHDDDDCPQPVCEPGGPCPIFMCEAGHCVEADTAACHDDEDCPQPYCLPGGPCPRFECDGGECVRTDEPPPSCGGIAGLTCPEGMFCDYDDDVGCGTPDASGTCAYKPETCTAEYDPVCGCDGVTYGNACGANAAGVDVAHEGECVTDCREAGCPEGRYCTFCWTEYACIPEGALC